MHASPILDPNGNRVFSVGGAHSWKQLTFRDLNVSFEWLITSGYKRKPPILCIWRATNVFANPGDGGNRGIWTISRNGYDKLLGTRLGHETKISGDPSAYLIREAREALPVLGFDRNDRNALRNVVDCVIHCAQDFAMMPPTPQQLMDKARAPMWEVQAINQATGKVISEAEV